MNKNKLFQLTFFFSISLILTFSSCANLSLTPHPKKTPTPTVGEPLPEINLTSPTDESIRNYLGLTNITAAAFASAQIDCEILLIEIFSMYCPFCQREAPAVNKLFKLIQDDPKLSRQIKLIGIGVGNSAFEVEIFKNKYDVKFPLFADADFTIHNDMGQVRTPFFIAIANRGEKKNQVILTKLGGFSSPDKFLRSLTRRIEPPVKGEN